MQKYRRQYWLRLITFFIITLTFALLCLPIFLGVLSMLGLLYAPCSQNAQTPADYGFPYESVVIEASPGGNFQGYFIPGTNGATIIMPPPFTSGRGVRLPEMEMLAKHGYSVFMFESRRCAGMGPLSLGYKEVGEVGDALDYLLSRPDVDPERIGIHGFSSAGATSVMAAARYPQLKAVVAEGGYGDFTENALGGGQEQGVNAYFIPLFRWASYFTYRLVIGLDISKLSPVSVIHKISPRPILLVYGSKETSLPGGRSQKIAAGDNAELWVVEGAGHGNYMRVAPEEYEKRIVTFFDTAFFP